MARRANHTHSTIHPSLVNDELIAWAKLTQHERERQQLASDIEAFLQRGGTIQQLPPNITSRDWGDDNEESLH